MPKRKPTPPQPEIPPRELRYYMMRILASSHDLWETCPHADCRRARRCVDDAFTCLDTPLRVEVERFLDWYA